jgi:ActR/RegA family two-component response regulator
MNQFATLIVEDTPDIQGSYQRAVERQGGLPVITSSYNDAVAAVKRRLFSVAIIDVRLSEDDETNVDGLRVLEFIKKTGDATKTILITGYGSFQIAREAFRDLEVFEGLEKGVSLSSIESTIKRAHEAFEKESSEKKPDYTNMLKGSSIALWDWEDKARRMCMPTGGIDGLYRFLETLLQSFSPLTTDEDGAGCFVNDANRIAAGSFWSRGQGIGVLIAFGKKAEVLKLQTGTTPPHLNNIFHEGAPSLGPLLKKAESHGVYGIVRKLEDQSFSPFDTSDFI